MKPIAQKISGKPLMIIKFKYVKNADVATAKSLDQR
jgi:hypothetical protein